MTHLAKMLKRDKKDYTYHEIDSDYGHDAFLVEVDKFEGIIRDILEEEIAAMIMDVSSLAITLNKPLGVRILPIPGKKGNELTGFNYDFLVDIYNWVSTMIASVTYTIIIVNHK